MRASRPDLDGGVDSPTLVSALSSITAGSSRAESLRRLLVHACALGGTDYGALVALGAHRRVEEVLHHGIDPEVAARLARLPRVREILADVAAATEPLLHDGPVETGDAHDAHPRFGAVAGIPLRAQGELLGMILLAHDDAPHADDPPPSRFPPDVAEQLVALGQVAGYLLQIARAERLAERRRVWLDRGSRLAVDLGTSGGLDDALTAVAAGALAASPATGAVIVSVPDDGASYPAAVCGAPPVLDAAQSDTLDAAVRAVADARETGQIDLSGGTALLAPLGEHLRVPSILLLHYPGRSAPDTYEVDLLGAYAEQAGLSLDRFQALQERAAMAVVTDRDRIARELHDVVIQRLFATGLHLQKSRAMAEDPELRERLSLTAHDLDQTIRAIRGTIFDLREQPRQSLRLVLRDLVERHSPALGFTPTVRTRGPVDQPLGHSAQERLVEVLDEALDNVVRHSGASAVEIELEVGSALVRVRVADDGQGSGDLSLDGVPDSGLGSLRRRLRLIGGTLDLWQVHPTGTALVAQVPRD